MYIHKPGSILHSQVCTFFSTINVPCVFHGCRTVRGMDVPFVSTLAGQVPNVDTNAKVNLSPLTTQSPKPQGFLVLSADGPKLHFLY